MRTFPLVAAGAVALAGLTVVGATTSAVHAEPAYRAYALAGSSLLTFDIADPGDADSVTISGVGAGETLTGLDARPLNGQLYTLGVNPTTGNGTLYVLHEQTGSAVAVGAVGGVDLVDPLPDPATVRYGLDFNPVVDRVRVTAGAYNLRVNASTGLVAGADAPINGATTNVDSVAYTNNESDSGVFTTLYTLDAVTDSLYIQNPPNNGTQAMGQAVTLGGSPLDFTAAGGFDIPTGVDAPASNAPVASGSGYAALTVGGISRLYTVDLVTGAATLVGPVGEGILAVRGLALQRDVDEGYPAIGLSLDGSQLVRFTSTAPTTQVSQPIAGIDPAEQLAAIAWRTATGQLFGLGVDPVADTGTLYRIDPMSGSAAPIASSQVAWVQANGVTPVQLPDPDTTGYGLDVSPMVDRFRVTTGTGLNARINPSTGAAVDTDANAGNGVNPDASTTPGLMALAYTNPYAGTTVTTAYGLEPSGNQLMVLNPPNAGTLGSPVTVTLGGSTLDFASIGGLEILEDVSVATAGAPATGSAYADLVVGGQPGLYRINLATGSAVQIGSLTAPLRSLTLGQAGANRPAPPEPPVAVPATLTKSGATRQVKKAIDTGRTLACPSAFLSSSCSTTIKVTATYKVRVKGKTKTRSIVVGKATVKTARGKSTRLKVTLSKGGVKLLKQKKTLAAKVAITAPTGALAAKRTTTVKVKLSRKRL